MKICRSGFNSFLLIIFSFLISCSSDENEPKIGNVSGKVTLYDILRNEIIDKQGVFVELVSETETFSTFTNSNGEFVFESIPYGDLRIRFEKENYRGLDSLDFKHLLPADSLNFITLVESPPATGNLNLVRFETDRILPWITVNFNLDTYYSISTWFYFSRSPEVSASNFEGVYQTCCTGGDADNPCTFAPGIEHQFFYEHNFSSGDKIYVVSYQGSSKMLIHDYPETGIKVLPTHNNIPSNTNWFIMP